MQKLSTGVVTGPFARLLDAARARGGAAGRHEARGIKPTRGARVLAARVTTAAQAITARCEVD